MTARTDQIQSKAGRIVISVDAMGGDKGPAAIVAGCDVSARKNPNISFILHGPEAELRALINRRKSLQGRCEVRNSTDIVTMDDKPSQVVRNGKDTSMWSAIEAVRANEASVTRTSAVLDSPKVTIFGRCPLSSRTRAVRATAPGSSALTTSSRTRSLVANRRKPSA